MRVEGILETQLYVDDANGVARLRAFELGSAAERQRELLRGSAAERCYDAAFAAYERERAARAQLLAQAARMSLAQELEAFRKANAALLARDGEAQRVAKPDAVTKGIPTLAEGTYRAPSAQVAARFAAAGRWELAWLRERWLGIADMEAAWRDRAIQKQIALRRENWPQSAFGETAAC